jgi:hypothetical protein
VSHVPHVHDWRPLCGWSARYRCAECFAIGYKKRAVMGFGANVILPYTCSKCDGWAVARDYNRPPTARSNSRQWRCRLHRGYRRDGTPAINSDKEEQIHE